MQTITNKFSYVLMGLVCLWVLLPEVAYSDETTDSIIEKSQNAYEQGNFQEIVDSLKPVLKKMPVPFAATRLNILALARLGETPAALDAYEAQVKSSKREDEGLIRQMAIASIMPRQTDMREQIRGAAYTALKEIDSDEVIPYLEDGLTDASGMLRPSVAEALAKRTAGQ